MIPIEFVFNKFNCTTLGSYERDYTDNFDFISIYIDAIALMFDNQEDNLITQICCTIEHEIWHYLLKDLHLNDDQQHELIATLMRDKKVGEFKDDLGDVLEQKTKHIEREINIAYG